MNTATEKEPEEELTHDTQYIKYLQRAYGTTSVPFFGAIICTVSLLIIIMIFIVNASVVFIGTSTEVQLYTIGADPGPPKIQLSKPIVL